MRLQLVSDLHTEFYPDPVMFVESLAFEPGLDFLLVPGDVVTSGQPPSSVRGVLQALSSKARHVVYTVGNHEYYHNGPGGRQQTEDTLAANMPGNFHWLRNSAEEIDGVEFFGGPLWFPDDPDNEKYSRQLNDFGLIRGFRDWVYQENREFVSQAVRLVRDSTVVLSHHIPATEAIAPQYRGDKLNRFFVSDMGWLIRERQPRLWVFGHTHTPADLRVGEARLLCNPYGYPHERWRQQPYPPVVVEL